MPLSICVYGFLFKKKLQISLQILHEVNICWKNVTHTFLIPSLSFKSIWEMIWCVHLIVYNVCVDNDGLLTRNFCFGVVRKNGWRLASKYDCFVSLYIYYSTAWLWIQLAYLDVDHMQSVLYNLKGKVRLPSWGSPTIVSNLKRSCN